MNFWKEWTAINIARLNSLFATNELEFANIEYSNKLTLVRSGDNWHIQPTYLVDNIGHDEVLATINYVKNEYQLKSQISAVIPSLESESTYFKKRFGLNNYWNRSSFYRINLSSGSTEDVLLAMESRQRSKIKNKIDSYIIEEIKFTYLHASLFAKQQILWGVPKLNYFTANDLVSISDRFEYKLWRATCSNSGILYILILENHHDAYFFLSATTDDYARVASLYVHWEIIKNLIERNFNCYHLGGGVISGDGVERFKKSLGASVINRCLYPITMNMNLNGKYFPNWLEQLIHPVSENEFDP